MLLPRPTEPRRDESAFRFSDRRCMTLRERGGFVNELALDDAGRAGWRRRGRQHVADRRDAPPLFSSFQHQRRPHAPCRASGESRQFVTPVGDRHIGRQHPYGLYGNGALPARVPRTLHRPANHRVAPFTSFARRHKLVRVTREQFFDRLRVNALARVDIFTHDLADRGLIIAAGVVLSEPRRGGNNATKDRKLGAHNAFCGKSWERRLSLFAWFWRWPTDRSKQAGMGGAPRRILIVSGGRNAT